jgi:hypothetical protein
VIGVVGQFVFCDQKDDQAGGNTQGKPDDIQCGIVKVAFQMSDSEHKVVPEHIRLRLGGGCPDEEQSQCHLPTGL